MVGALSPITSLPGPIGSEQFPGDAKERRPLLDPRTPNPRPIRSPTPPHGTSPQRMATDTFFAQFLSVLGSELFCGHFSLGEEYSTRCRRAMCGSNWTSCSEPCGPLLESPQPLFGQTRADDI